MKPFFRPCAVLALLAAVLLPFPSMAATTYIPVGDEMYHLLDRLELEGLIPSGLLNARPMSRAEVERLLLEAESSNDPREFVKDLIASLRRRLRTTKEPAKKMSTGVAIDAKYIRTDTTLPLLRFNNDGDKYAKGENLRLGADLRLENAGTFAVDLAPEYRDTGSDEDQVIRRGYVVAGMGKFDLVLGKDSQWWGPGRHGAILLTNDAEPFTMVRLTNPQPITLPWFLDALGPFKVTAFLTRLDHTRDFSYPYLWGLRFDFKPSPKFAIGLERTSILGGKGRPNDWKTWRSNLLPFANAENTGTVSDPGDQRAGFDLTWTLPFERQPVQFYLEGAGEDEKNNLPNIWAWVGGIYLPRIGSLDRLDFRFEAGTTKGRRLAPDVWYHHYIYTTGYTYQGRIIGHHMGTDARDLYFELSYHLPEHDTRLVLAYDREEQRLHGVGTSEVDHELLSGILFGLGAHLECSLQYNRAWIRNLGNQSSRVDTINNAASVVRYRF